MDWALSIIDQRILLRLAMVVAIIGFLAVFTRATSLGVSAGVGHVERAERNATGARR
jgi:hypothetical protein